jgi:hypothetical protein
VSATGLSTARLRLPVRGDELLELRYKGMVPRAGWCGAHVLVVIDSSEIARNRWRLMIKPEDDPDQLDFSGCAGLETILIHDSGRTNTGRLKRAIRAILKGKPSSLATFDVVRPYRPTLIKSHKFGVELAEYLDAQ